MRICKTEIRFNCIPNNFSFRKFGEQPHLLSAVATVIAAISPLLGLLGTVTGMYSVFETIAAASSGEMHKLSGGIAEALVTTIVGLVIAIPAYVAYSFFSRRVEELVLEMERLAVGLMLRLRARPGRGNG